MALRIDVGSLRSPRFRPDGGANVDGALTRTGVFVYRNADGTERREYRPAAEVFKADSLASFEGVALTDDHPPESISADNARTYARGAVLAAPKKDGNWIVAPISVFDAALVAKMRSGKVQLSCGYDVDLVEQPGTTPDGERYDAVQTNIRGNHVAIVDIARAGSAARVRMDAAEQVVDPQENRMDEALKKALAELAAATVRADTADKRVTDLEAQVASQTARADVADKALAAEKSARTDTVAAFPAAVAARVALEVAAKPILGDDFKAELTDDQIRRAVVKKVDGDDLAADAHVEYVRARYDAAAKHGDKTVDLLANMRAATVPGAAPTPGGLGFDNEQTAARKARERADAEYTAFASRNDAAPAVERK